MAQEKTRINSSLQDILQGFPENPEVKDYVNCGKKYKALPQYLSPIPLIKQKSKTLGEVKQNVKLWANR